MINEEKLEEIRQDVQREKSRAVDCYDCGGSGSFCPSRPDRCDGCEMCERCGGSGEEPMTMEGK